MFLGRHGRAAISIELGPRQRTGWSLRGPLIRPDERRFRSPATLVGIRLRPGVAFLLTGTSAHAMVGRRIDVHGHAAFEPLVAEPQPLTPEEGIDVLQRFLLRRLSGLSVPPVIATALQEIQQAHGCVRIPDVAARCGISVRHLHRLLRLWIGYGPKRYASILRFQATLHEMDEAPGRTASTLASRNGYFDQAHFALDAARFVGATPGRLAGGVADFSKTRCDDLP